MCYGEPGEGDIVWQIGIFDETGSIHVGKKADFVLLDKKLNIVGVYVDGKEAGRPGKEG